MAPSVDLVGGLAVGDSLTNWSLGGCLQAPPALVFGRGGGCALLVLVAWLAGPSISRT